MPNVRSRAAVLVHPWFTAAVMVLALNDHVLKARWPGLVTGKLSDVAGVVVVAVLASCVIGWRAGVAATAIGFVALKAVPGFAESVAPVLGGVTRRDPADLVGLLALVPLGRWLAGRSPPMPRGERRVGVLGTTLGLAAVSTAMLTTTATSCLEPTSIESVAIVDGQLLAGGGGVTWGSADGGATWRSTETRVPAATIESCVGESCFRVETGEHLERCSGDECTEVYTFDDEQRRRMALQADCGTDADGDFLAVAAGEVEGGPPLVLVAMGQQGVLVGHDTFERVAVDDAVPLSVGGPPSWTQRLGLAPVALFLAGPALALVGLWRRWSRTATAAAVAMTAGLTLFVGAGIAGFVGLDFRVVGIVVAGLSVVVFALSVLLALRRREAPSDRPGPMIPPSRP